MRRVVCVCSAYRCSEHTHVDAASGNTVPGRLVGLSTRVDHQRIQREREQQQERQWARRAERDTDPDGEAEVIHPSTVHPDGDHHGGLDAELSSSRVQQTFALTSWMFQHLGAWINVSAGVSRNRTHIILVAIQMILSGLVSLLWKALTALGYEQWERPELDTPRDVRTLYSRLNIEPKIVRTICCPKCFKLYPTRNRHGQKITIPSRCTWRAGPGTLKDCGTRLFRVRQNLSRTGKKSHRVAMRFSVQDFDSWLRWFLNRPGIEALINESYGHQQPAPGGLVTSLWESRAWHEGIDDGFSLQVGNLTFGLYVDWFNPFTNKIAGET